MTDTVKRKKLSRPQNLTFIEHLTSSHASIFAVKKSGSSFDYIALTKPKTGKLILPKDALGVRYEFTITLFGNIGHADIDKPTAYSNALTELGRQARDNGDLESLANRYAKCIATGNYLQKNKAAAKAINIRVLDKKAGKKWKFNPNRIVGKPSFPCHDETVSSLGEHIYVTLKHPIGYTQLSVTADTILNNADAIYPTLIASQTSGKFVPFYREGSAALHKESIGEHLHCVDTWYTENVAAPPITVGPFGNITLEDGSSRALRDMGTGKNVYELMDKYANTKNISDLERMYILAIMIKGGSI